MFSQEQYEALTGRAGLLDRRRRGRLALTGADRRGYLHGLLTNDIAALSAGTGCYAALLTPQGRMISDMRVSELGERILIDLPAATTGAVRERLADFIFSEDVEVHDVGESLAQFALYGPHAARILAAVAAAPSGGGADGAAREAQLASLPVNANTPADVAGSPAIVVRSDDYGVAGFEIFVEAPAAGALAEALRRAGAVDVEQATADVCRVEAGRPRFGSDMDEHTIPLEAGIEDRAISLTKGCYVGQEVIIRVLHRGQGRVAKRLVGFVANGADGPLVRGDRLLDAAGKDAGAVTSAVHSPRLRRPIGLGYVRREYAEPGAVLQAAGAAGNQPRGVTVVSLPFTAPAGG